MEKLYITAEDLLRDSFRLGLQILQSGFRPDYIVGIWRGGAPIGIAVQELFAYYGFLTDHIAIRTSYYTAMDEPADAVRVHGLGYIAERITAEDKLLLVDDVFDSGRSIQATKRELARACGRNMPQELKAATIFYKPKRNETDLVPDYFVRECDDWLVFPHELQGLSQDEIAAGKRLGLDLPPPEAFRESGA